MAGLFPSDVDPVAEAQRILMDAIDEHKPVAVVGLFSGGTDSHCATHLAAASWPLRFVAHINTQTGIRQTRDFVVKKCLDYGWNFREYSPPMPRQFGNGKRNPIVPIHADAKTAYEAYCYQFGFPGPWMHGIVYRLLKERCVRQILKEVKRKKTDRVVLVSGVRQAESKRRMGKMSAVERDGSAVWVAPMLRWSDEDKEAYMQAQGIEKSVVSRQLCMSGECLCGCFAKPGELVAIAHHFPESAAYLRQLQDRLRAAGVDRCNWGIRPEEERRENSRHSFAGLCWSCETKTETEQAATADAHERYAQDKEESC